MLCKQCGSEIREGARFCTKCGTGISSFNVDLIYQEKDQPPLKERTYQKSNIGLLLLAVFLVIVVSALVLWRNSANPTKKYEKQIEIGNRFLSELEYEQAVAAYEEAVLILPKRPEAYTALIDVYRKTGNPEHLVDTYDTASVNLDESDAVIIEEKVVDALVDMSGRMIESEEYDKTDVIIQLARDRFGKEEQNRIYEASMRKIDVNSLLLSSMSEFLRYMSCYSEEVGDFNRIQIRKTAHDWYETNLLYLVMSYRSCVNLNRYGDRIMEIHQDEADARGIFSKKDYYTGYTRFDAESIDWIILNVFGGTEEDIVFMRDEATRESMSGDEYVLFYYMDDCYYRDGTTEMAEPDVKIVFLNAISNGVFYRVDYAIYKTNYKGEDDLINYYTALLEEKDNGINYWSLYEITASSERGVNDRYDKESDDDVNDVFSMITGNFFYHSSVEDETKYEITVQDDGTFSGRFYKEKYTFSGTKRWISEMQECSFKGRFDNIVKLSEKIYSVYVNDLVTDEEPGTISVKHNVDGGDYSSVTMNPYDMENGKEYLIILPGAKTEKLPAQFISTVATSLPAEETSGIDWNPYMDSFFPITGIYSFGGGYGYIKLPNSFYDEVEMRKSRIEGNQSLTDHEYEDIYRIVLDYYYDAIVNAEDGTQLWGSFFTNANEFIKECGYYFLDLNKDGIKELIIVEGGMVVRLYTVNEDGEIQILISWWNNSRIFYAMTSENDLFYQITAGFSQDAYYSLSALSDDGDAMIELESLYCSDLWENEWDSETVYTHTIQNHDKPGVYIRNDIMPSEYIVTRDKMKNSTVIRDYKSFASYR